MESFWDFSVWGVLNLIAVLLISLLLANILLKVIRPLRGSLIPTSVLGGMLLLVTSWAYRKITGVDMFDTPFFGGRGSTNLEIITYHALALGFIASTFKSSQGRLTGKRMNEIFNTGVTTVATYILQGICGLAGTTATLPALKIDKMTHDATLCLVSVDGYAPLQQARRMALVFATNALNTGMTFQGEDMAVYTKKGTTPVLVLCGQFDVTITNKNAAKLSLYPLDFTGKRLKKIQPYSVQGDSARFTVDMRNDGHAFFYELSVE